MINKFSILNWAKYFSSGLFQNNLVFIQTKKYIKYFSDTSRIESWKLNGISVESIDNITKSDSYFVSTLSFITRHEFNGLRLIKKYIFIPKKVINLNVSYTLGPQLKTFNH